MRLDAHQHFWRYNAEQYGWIGDSMHELKRSFLPRDLKPLLDAAGLDGSIAVQARQDLEETRWLLELAAENEWIRGVVGWVDLRSAELAAQLDEFAAHAKFVGVRHLVQDEPDDEFMLRPAFREGVGKLASYELTYDLLLYPRHLPVALKLVREFPEQRFVLDHIGKPGIAEGVMRPWEDGIRGLAKSGNVWCKVSGMVTEARWKQWRGDDLRPYLDVVFAAFGPERLMVGSDWPVCTVSGSYAETLGVVGEYVAQCSKPEQEGVWGENCEKFYGVE